MTQYTIVTFISLIGIYLIHRLIYRSLINRYSNSPQTQDENLYRIPRWIGPLDAFMIIIIFLNMVFSLLSLNDNGTLISKVFMLIVVVIHILFEIPFLYRVNLCNSFFYCGEDYWEFNLSFENSPKHTITIQKLEIDTVEKKRKFYILHMRNGMVFRIRLSTLRLLKNHKALERYLEDWKL